MLHKSQKTKNFLTIIGFSIIFILLVKYLLTSRREMALDSFLSLASLTLFYFYYKKLSQDNISYFFFLFSLVLHCFGLYGASFLGIMFDHYMHFIAGFALAIFADRLFFEKMSNRKRVILLLLFSLGIGAIGEIIEWMGYGILGSGEGFLYYGIGDEGEWNNSIKDLIFNSFGAVFYCILRFIFNKLKPRNS